MPAVSSLVNGVTVFPKQSDGFLPCFFLIELDLEYGFFKLTVVDDTDIFNADTVGSQDCSQGGNSSGFVHHIAVNRVDFFERSP